MLVYTRERLFPLPWFQIVMVTSRRGVTAHPLEHRYSLDRHIAGFIHYGIASTPTWDRIYSKRPVHTFQWLTCVTEALAQSAFPATSNIFSQEWRYWVSHLLEPLKLWNIYYLENTPFHRWRPLIVSKFYLTWNHLAKIVSCLLGSFLFLSVEWHLFSSSHCFKYQLRAHNLFQALVTQITLTDTIRKASLLLEQLISRIEFRPTNFKDCMILIEWLGFVIVWKVTGP